MMVTPQDWPIYGHTTTIHFLQQITQPNNSGGHKQREPQHAYLLLGPRQVGKSTVARLFARALLCTDEHQRPCGRCRGCQLTLRGNHPDFRLIQPLDKNGEIDRVNGTLRTEQATEIVHDVALRPMESRYKVFLIQDAHLANDSFANKLLKTLEEPPAYAVFCLSALARSNLLPTIVSRCQVLELRALAPQTVIQALQAGWQVDAEKAELIGRLSQGRLGWAVDQLTYSDQLQHRLDQLQSLWQLMRADPVDRLNFAEKGATTFNSQQLFDLVNLWITWWRDLLLTHTRCEDACCNIDQMGELKRQAGTLSLAQIRNYLHTLQRIEKYLQHTINVRLALEVLVLQMPSLSG
ncbi:MAG: DNA polymerase III subunit [Caldilineaceae bacterium]